MFMHCITKEGREKMRDLNIITVSGTVNREPTYKENKENSNKTILYYSLEIYTGRDYYPDKEKKELVHEKIYLNCVNYGKLAMELVNKVKKGSYVQVSGELRPNNYDRADGGKVYGLKIMANTCIPINQPEQQNNNQNTQKQNQNNSSKRQQRQSNHANPQNQESRNSNRGQHSEMQGQNTTETSTSVPPKKRATMPMAQEVNQQGIHPIEHQIQISRIHNLILAKMLQLKEVIILEEKILKDQINSQVVVIMSLLVLHRKKIHLIWQR